MTANESFIAAMVTFVGSILALWGIGVVWDRFERRAAQRKQKL